MENQKDLCCNLFWVLQPFYWANIRLTMLCLVPCENVNKRVKIVTSKQRLGTGALRTKVAFFKSITNNY